MRPASEIAAKDPRTIVLYVRSFQDDRGIKLYARATDGRILLERLVKISFEELVTDHLWSYGPVLAIGDPRAKKKATLGAARDYATDASWQEKATDLMHRASIIVMIAGATSGLVWEIETILRLGFRSKIMLLFPPIAIEDLERRWQFLVSNIFLDLPLEIDLLRTRALVFPKGKVCLITGDLRNDWTYEAALDEAALMIVS